MPSSLKSQSRWERLSSADVPTLLVQPDWNAASAHPTVLWMHGRTACKELDSGRYLRWMRAGFAVCTVDLPGHGERKDEVLQEPARTLDVVTQMAEEIDQIVASLPSHGPFDTKRIAIGGISAGGMATLLRLCRPHGFQCATVEATSGSWTHQRQRDMFRNLDDAQIATLDPSQHFEQWREIPLQAIHSRLDEWMSIDGQTAFIESLRQQYQYPDQIEFIVYDQTGAPYEHIGFGRKAADAKNRQTAFLKRHLLDN